MKRRVLKSLLGGIKRLIYKIVFLMITKSKAKLYNLLRWSEKWTKTDMIYLARGGFWLTLGKVVSSTSAFLLAIAFANLLPKETYGEYKYILSIASILAIPTLSGMGTAITQAVARGYEGIVIPAMKEKIKWGLLSAVASIGLSGYYWHNGNTTLTFAFLICAVFLPFMDAFGIYGAFLSGKKMFGVSTKYNIFSRVVIVSIMITTIYYSNNIFLVIFTYFLSNTFFRVIFLIITHNKFNFTSNKDQAVISYGKHLSFMKGLNILSGNINNIFLFHFLGSQSLAVFSFAVAPIEQIRSLLSIPISLIFPKISNNQWKVPAYRLFLKKLLPFLLILILCVISYILIAPTFFKVFFPKYLDATKFSQIYSISLIITIISTIQVQILKAKKQIKKLHIINITDAILNIFLTLPFIYYHGIWGLIYAYITIKTLQNIIMSTLIFKKPPKNAPKLN